MPPTNGYPIEEFLEAITAQLDQTQDALRLKAVNRPLTFALKDFNVDLKVFVEMDANGRVTFRPAAPNEEGASTVTIGFTTITRPMIEENTISMEMAQAPGLDELGLEREDSRRLAKIGVRNAAQLKNFQRSAGEDTMSRHTGVDIAKLRSALNLARPRLDEISPDIGGAAPAPTRPPIQPPTGASPWVDTSPMPAPTPTLTPAPPREPRPIAPDTSGLAPQNLTDRLRDRLKTPPQTPNAKSRLKLAKGAKDIRLNGANLIEAGRTPVARLDGRTLPTLSATQSAVAFGIPEDVRAGTLAVELPDGTITEYDIHREDGQ
ncbi:hypothetical protein [Celeribacter arenosi]|uniref:Uncharacterized protein n=1 Tax=Celeribacter arenosi TaxID=792649 RepID=A0ABP7KGR3_9RHOB